MASAATSKAVMSDAENNAGPAEARPELLSHMVIELVEYRQIWLWRQAQN